MKGTPTKLRVAPPTGSSVSYYLSYRKCGKQTCRTCAEGAGHGPYWYATWREDRKVRTAYLGREKPGEDAASLTVQALGSLVVTREDGVVVSWGKRSRELFTLLLSAPTGTVGRDEVAESIWPDSDPIAAHQSVRSAVTSVRNLLGGLRYVVIDGPEVTLKIEPDVRDDVMFEDAAVRALASDDFDQISAALSLYTGTYLPQDRYSDWTIYRRQRLGDFRRDLTLKGTQRAEPRGRFQEAAQWLRSLLAEEPYDEPAVRALMRILSVSGRRPEALLVYHAFTEAIKRDLEVQPDSETELIATRIAEGKGN